MPKTDLGANTTTDLWATFHFKTQGQEKLQVVTSGFLLVHSTDQLILHFRGVITFNSEAAKHMVKMYNSASLPPNNQKGKQFKPELWTVELHLAGKANEQKVCSAGLLEHN